MPELKRLSGFCVKPGWMLMILWGFWNETRTAYLHRRGRWLIVTT